MHKIGHRIKLVRSYLRKSQEDFGAEMGVSQSRQSRIEKGEGEIKLSYLERIDEKYGDVINKEWLRFGTGDMLVNQVNSEEGNYYTTEEDKGPIQVEDSQLLYEVKKFSQFLKCRPLRAETKRKLIQLLLESMEPRTIDDPNSNQEKETLNGD